MYEINKLTPDGYLIRIIPSKGVYTIFYNNEYILPRIKQDKQSSANFPLQKIIFIGDMFTIYQANRTETHFLPTTKNIMSIPFSIQDKDTSDIRHVHIYSEAPSDLVPVYVIHLININIDLLINSLKKGLQYLL